MVHLTRRVVIGAGWTVLFAAFAISACATGGSPAFAHAIAGNGCTQEDILGVEIILSSDEWKADSPATAPHIRIEMTRPRPGVPVEVELSPLKRDPTKQILARAALLTDKSNPVWLTGALRFQQDTTTRAIEGSYSFCAADRRCFSGPFVAVWRPGAARCG